MSGMCVSPESCSSLCSSLQFSVLGRLSHEVGWGYRVCVCLPMLNLSWPIALRSAFLITLQESHVAIAPIPLCGCHGNSPPNEVIESQPFFPSVQSVLRLVTVKVARLFTALCFISALYSHCSHLCAHITGCF